MIPTRFRSALAAGAIAASLVFGLAACSPSAESVAGELHASVVQVATRAQAGDYLGALAELALLDNDVTAAVDNGTIDAEQAQEIREALALVQVDLEAAEAATTPTPEPEPAPDEGDDSGPGNSDDDQGNDDKGNDDKGNDKGNGGKGNGDD
ncbi:hypothetical protein [Agromyces subbeticus]|uniref:hypothetical protein n=1 Tax=Agromyces subbeticus TaxID=293890 RepID=UPI0003B3DC66|nr:hypothetical protein [Agromyces subbeticus]